MAYLLDTLAELTKAYLLPGSLSLFLILTTVLVAWWFMDPGRRRGLRTAMLLVVGSYWLMSFPWFANFMENVVIENVDDSRSGGEVGAMVVLGGGGQVYRLEDSFLAELSDASASRALEAARLFREQEPEWVFVSGGPGREASVPESWPMRDALIQLGVPPERIILESTSSDTRAQAVLLAPILEEKGISEFHLVTSAIHMRRARLAFEAVGLNPIPVPAQSYEAGDSPRAALPSLEALGQTSTVARELMAMVYYWARGWF